MRHRRRPTTETFSAFDRPATSPTRWTTTGDDPGIGTIVDDDPRSDRDDRRRQRQRGQLRVLQPPSFVCPAQPVYRDGATSRRRAATMRRLTPTSRRDLPIWDHDHVVPRGRPLLRHAQRGDRGLHGQRRGRRRTPTGPTPPPGPIFDGCVSSGNADLYHAQGGERGPGAGRDRLRVPHRRLQLRPGAGSERHRQRSSVGQPSVGVRDPEPGDLQRHHRRELQPAEHQPGGHPVHLDPGQGRRPRRSSRTRRR